MMMGRKKKHPEHENLERWLVSYADFITLLFATFTALYAIATAKLKDVNDAAGQISNSFQRETILEGIASVFQGQSTPAENPNPIFEETGRGEGVIGAYESLTFTQGEVERVEEFLEELDEIADELAQKLKQAQAGAGKENNLGEGQNPALGLKPEKGELEGVPLRGLEVAMQQRGLRISFDSRLLFRSGSAQLDERTTAFLDSVAARLLKLLSTHLVHVEGHTDSTPIGGRYPSNWELSTARASTVVRYLIRKHKFAPTDLAAVGYAESRPVAPNNTPENMAKNRRIDIILHSRAQEKETNPAQQRHNERVLIDEAHRYTRGDQRKAQQALAQQKPTQAAPKPDAPPNEIRLPIFNPDGTVKNMTPPVRVQEQLKTGEKAAPAELAPPRREVPELPAFEAPKTFSGAEPAKELLRPAELSGNRAGLLKSEGEF